MWFLQNDFTSVQRLDGNDSVRHRGDEGSPVREHLRWELREVSWKVLVRCTCQLSLVLEMLRCRRCKSYSLACLLTLDSAGNFILKRTTSLASFQVASRHCPVSRACCFYPCTLLPQFNCQLCDDSSVGSFSLLGRALAMGNNSLNGSLPSTIGILTSMRLVGWSLATQIFRVALHVGVIVCSKS